MDTCFNYCNKEKAYFSSDEWKWINKIHKLKEQYPEEVDILNEPEDNDGSIYCTVPVSWLKIQPKRKVSMSDEEREILRERLARMRASSRS